ncbi:MAG: septum formation protein Maf [Rickettsiales bacterium]|nr:septum formation protein Maf [Rickettsiales bacterium]
MLDFILASGSQVRLKLLRQIGVEPKAIKPADIDETPLKKEKPIDYVQRMAKMKAEAIAGDNQNENVLSADSIVVVRNRIIQKPKDKKEIELFLNMYSGKNVKCYSAVYFIKKNGSVSKKLVLTKIKFKHLTSKDINDVLSDEKNLAYSSAGGLLLEGFTECLIKSINGSYSNILGLPLYDVRNMLISAGVL